MLEICSYCSNLILSGSDLKDVTERIGHRDLSTTDRWAEGLASPLIPNWKDHIVWEEIEVKMLE